MFSKKEAQEIQEDVEVTTIVAEKPVVKKKPTPKPKAKKPVKAPKKVEKDTSKDCIFCGEHTNLTKFVNLQTVAICEAHYYSETTGKIAQKIREREHAKSKG